MVFGSTLRLPGEFISSEDEEHNRRVFTSEFRLFMQAIRPISDTDHDPIKKGLDPPYLGPYKVDNRPSEAFYNVLIPNKLGREESKTITTLRLKPAFSSYFDHHQALDADDANPGNLISVREETTKTLSDNDCNLLENFDCNNEMLPFDNRENCITDECDRSVHNSALDCNVTCKELVVGESGVSEELVVNESDANDRGDIVNLNAECTKRNNRKKKAASIKTVNKCRKNAERKAKEALPLISSNSNVKCNSILNVEGKSRPNNSKRIKFHLEHTYCTQE
ncbi:hypothetical protein TKK_0016994 [Trichogramma kaykai]